VLLILCSGLRHYWQEEEKKINESKINNQIADYYFFLKTVYFWNCKFAKMKLMLEYGLTA